MLKSTVFLKLSLFIIFLGLVLFQAGCSVHYYDKKTQTEHLWGFGHMRMKVTTPEENVKATIKGTKIIGLGVSKTKEDLSLVGGINDQRRAEIVDEDAAVKVEWPDNSLFNIRVGTEPPFLEKADPPEDPSEPQPEESQE